MLRIIAVLLIAAAVPVQGMASVAAGQCMALGHHQGDAAAESHAHEGHDRAAHGHDDADARHGDDGKSSHCGPCTACCASASIAGPAGISFPSTPSDAPYVFSQSPPLAVPPGELDRPPLAL